MEANLKSLYKSYKTLRNGGGGLKLVDLKNKDLALKCQWVASAKNSENIGSLANQFLPPVGVNCNNLWMCNLHKRDIINLIMDSFWRDVLLAWAETYVQIIDSPTKIATQIIWYNSMIRIRNKPIYFEKAAAAGILFIYNIWNPIQRRFFNFQEILQIYGQDSISFLDYYGILSAIPRNWVSDLNKTRYILDTFEFPFESFEGKMTSVVYEKLTANKTLLVKTYTKWQDKINTNFPYDTFLQAFSDLYKLTPSTTLRDFQFRFLHRTIFCNKQLYNGGWLPDLIAHSVTWSQKAWNIYFLNAL